MQIYYTAVHSGFPALYLVTDQLQAVPIGLWASHVFWLSSVIDLAAGSDPVMGMARMHKGVRVVSGGYANVSLFENLVQCPLSFPP